MSKLIIVLSIFALVILMIQNFKLKRNIQETEKTIDELEEDRIEKKIYKNSYINLRKEHINLIDKMAEEKLKFPIEESETKPILLRIEVDGIPTDIAKDQYYSINCTKLDSYNEKMYRDEDFSYIQGKRLEVLYRYRDIVIHSIKRVSIKTIEIYEVPKVIREDFISYLENKKLEITEYIKNSELPQERKDNLKRDLDIFISNSTKEVKRRTV